MSRDKKKQLNAQTENVTENVKILLLIAFKDVKIKQEEKWNTCKTENTSQIHISFHHHRTDPGKQIMPLLYAGAEPGINFKWDASNFY